MCVEIETYYIYICMYVAERENKDKRTDRTIISIDTLNDIMTVNREEIVMASV